MISYIPLLMQGAAITIAAWLVASSISIIIGVLLGITSCRTLANNNRINGIRIYTFITKAIPAYVQILIAYFVIPALLGIQIPGFLAATLALGICSSGYMTEIIRAGVNAVPSGQWDAGKVLGYSNKSLLKRIILPQMIAQSWPTIAAELEQLLKSSSLLATIGVMELTRAGMNIISRELNPIPVYLAIAGIYLFFSAVITGITCMIEKRMRYGYR